MLYIYWYRIWKICSLQALPMLTTLYPWCICFQDLQFAGPCFYNFKIQRVFTSDRFQTFKLRSFDLRLIYTYPPKTNSSPLKMSRNPKGKDRQKQTTTNLRGNSLVSWRVLLMEEILHQLRLVVYPIICRVLCIPGGCLGFLPSTVLPFLTIGSVRPSWASQTGFRWLDDIVLIG